MHVAVMGYGVVGSGVVELFTKNHDSIVSRSTQSEMNLKYILDIRDFPNDPNKDKFIKNFDIILNDDDVKIVVETMGGIHPAYEFVLACLKAGKSVVTSNKELVATKGIDLLNAANENNVNFLFEASVGGGIPIIRPITQCLAANEIDEIAGILNGTTNFILTKMIDENMSFDNALKLAQEKGYAEKDPTADIEGHDASRKICILSSLSFGKHVYPDDVYTQGITEITLRDVEYATAWGGVIKLIGRAKRLNNGKIFAMVSPAFVRGGSQLASVSGVFNAILVRGDAIGDVVFYGKGAGKMPTASAVVADVIDCAKHTQTKKLFGWVDSEDGYVSNYLENPTTFYVRTKIKDKTQALKAVQEALGEVRLLTVENPQEDELAFITPEMPEGEFNKILSTLTCVEPLSTIRIVDY